MCPRRDGALFAWSYAPGAASSADAPGASTTGSASRRGAKRKLHAPSGAAGAGGAKGKRGPGAGGGAGEEAGEEEKEEGTEEGKEEGEQRPEDPLQAVFPHLAGGQGRKNIELS